MAATSSAHVAAIEIFHVRIPLRKAIGHSLATRTDTDNVVVSTTLDDGTTGYGEGVPRAYVTGDTIDSTYASLAEADWSARRLSSRRGRYTFEIHHHGGYVCGVSLLAPGRHNVVNALAAAALARENLACQADMSRGREIESVISRALSDFRGLHRRMELRGVHRGVAVIDDYAHHPTEVAAALATLRRMFPGRRVWCVFQPHQASRTERLLDELARALQNADKVLVAEIFRAREGPAKTAEVTAADLARAVRRGGAEAPDLHAAGAIARLLENSLAPGDVLITMGAGDIGRIADGFIHSVERFGEDRAAG